MDSGAAGDLLPYNVFQELYPNMPKSALENSINKNTCLVAYNKEEIKQLGTCVLKVNYGGKTIPQEFFVVGSRFKPIVGLDASRRLGLLAVNCPVYQSWTINKPIDSISGADADIPKMISKDWIVNNPKCYIVGLGLDCKFIDLLIKRSINIFIKISLYLNFIVLEIISKQTDTLM